MAVPRELNRVIHMKSIWNKQTQHSTEHKGKLLLHKWNVQDSPYKEAVRLLKIEHNCVQSEFWQIRAWKVGHVV